MSMTTDTSARTLPLDPNVAQRRASDPASSVWVGASAGSGKTKVLTDRVLRQMLAGTPPARILCLTFTKAAAAEMAIRVNNTLGLWATLPDADLEDRLADLCGERPSPETRTNARRLFAQVVDCPGGMKIQTIHAFCQSLLRRFPLEARLAPHFEVMDERTAAGLLTEARDQVLHAGRMEPDSPLGRAMNRLTADLNAEEFADLLAELASERGRIQRLFERFGSLDGIVGAVHDALKVAPGTTEASLLTDACRDDVFDAPTLREACRALSAGSASDQERGIGIQGWLDAADSRIRAFQAYQRLYLTAEGAPRKTLITKKAAAGSAVALAGLQAEAERLVEVAGKVKAAGVAASTSALLTLAEAMLESYRARKAARALLDYDDLILAAMTLLRGRNGVPAVPWVLFKLDGGLDHILIDEAQDTNPDQWEIVAAIAGEFFSELAASAGDATTRTVFAVGDEKQSIFSFQRADPAEFARMRRHFQERAEAAERVWAAVDLDISFRSTAAVLEAVDAVFASEAARDGVASAASPVIRHRAFRRGQAGLVELWPPVKPAEAMETPAWAPPVAREAADSPSARLAAIIAGTVGGWLERGELLEAKGRPVRPGDVMVLVRRRTGFVTELVRALKDRGVPVAGVDRMVLTEQLAVMDLMALADFLLLPDDDLTLATVLKGPLIGLTEEELFRLAHGRRGTLWRALVAAAETDPDVRPARRYLGDLLARTDFSAPYELFAGLLNRPCPADTRSGRRAILKRLGPDAQDPLDEFLAVCLAFEKTEPPSLQNFLAWLAASEAEIKRELDQGGGTVRIMTVHGSKGLQAPIVFLPDTLGNPTQSPPILWPDDDCPVPLFAARRTQEDSLSAEARSRANRRRDQEYRRLLYVALTRAEDRLYVCGYQGKREPPEGCWYKLVEAALSDSGVPQDFDFTHHGPEGWSGPGWRLAGPQTAVPPRCVAEEDAAADHGAPSWLTAPAPVEPEPSRPLTPSRPDGEEPAVRSPLGADDGQRFKRGLLVHRLLQTLPELEEAAREAACRRFLARPAHKLDAGQQDAIARETLAVLSHADFAHLFGAGSRAEVPLVGVVGNRTIAGRIDRLTIRGDTVWIVDYKTNRPPPRVLDDVPAVYRRQMAAYRAALEAVYPGMGVRCVLLWTDGPFAMELPAELLDAAGVPGLAGVAAGAGG
ncbi:ATP-dependent helicase/nuclease subunit A [Azospirillum agricola]|uniref:double-strand break repair helicase AddA n=1 Tax=Azospirillum agricola TaxID=1720247 RepID=UPI001AE6E98C|nr:double-strand break repair helicase AddA [Azospirillum agricola]MBP2229713.1 ATP-dependent helicase/nuclease subunit A [Azospirillum agricola]